jgi:hypothetical protein
VVVDEEPADAAAQWAVRGPVRFGEAAARSTVLLCDC